MKKFFPMLGIFVLATNLVAQTNIIFVTIDDLNKDSLGIHGCPVDDISPNLDALARSGLRFEHAHVAAANCTPSRNVMMSGMYSHNNGVLSVSNEGSGSHQTSPTMPDVFNAAGYHTGIMGKNGHQQPYDPFAGWDKEYDGYGSTRDPENVYEKLTNAFANAASEGKPLFFNLNLYDPHVSWYKWDHKNGVPKATTEKDPSRKYTADEVPYPSYMPPLSEAEMDFGNGYGVMDEVAAYYNTVKRADDSIGRMMEAIEMAEATSNTIIIVISDHGAEFPGAKTMLWHHSSVSPMFVVWPGVTSSNTVNDSHMINSVDFLPSFCELIGQPIPANIDGRSFLPIIKGEDPGNWPEHIYKEHNVAHNMRAVQTTNLLYIFNPWSDGSRRPSTVTDGHKCFEAIEDAAASGTNAFAAAWLQHFEHRTVQELYDITVDPDCFTNLAYNAAYASELSAMQALMHQQMINSGDVEILHAFTNLNDQTVLDQYMDDDQTMRNDMKNAALHTRQVFYDPHDDWHLIDHTIFEPSGNWSIWEAEGTGINPDSSNGDDKSGDNCIEFNGSVADNSRLIVGNVLDTSSFAQLKLDAIFIDSGAFSSGATLNFQYNDGSGWKTFQSLNSGGKKNLTFELPDGGLPNAMLFGIEADMNGSGGSIYMDHARLSAWQDWAAAPTNIPFDASDKGTVRVAFEFETRNFGATDKLLLEWFDGSAWVLLEEYNFGYAHQTNLVYADQIDMSADDYAFPENLEFRFRSEFSGSGQAFSINNLSIETREAMQVVELSLPPTANPDSYSESDPRAIVVPAPGVLDNDTPGTGGALSAVLISNVTNGILELDSDGSFVYAATNGYTGQDSFTYAASNATGSTTTTVTLAINEAIIDPLLFSDDFSSASAAGGGNGNGLPDPAKGWIAEGGYWLGSSDGTDGGMGCRMRSGASIMTKMLDTTGYTGITLLFDGKSEALASGQEMTIEWSDNNGASWSNLGSVPVTITDYQAFNMPLPVAADDNPEFGFRFKGNSDANSKRGYFDNVVVTGTPPATAGTITNYTGWASVHSVSTNSGSPIDYAFNINPHLSERYNLTDSGNSGLPLWEISETENRLEIEYIRRKQAADLTYQAQFTDNLESNWVNATLPEIVTPIDDEFERVLMKDEKTTAQTTNRFGRVILILD